MAEGAEPQGQGLTEHHRSEVSNVEQDHGARCEMVKDQSRFEWQQENSKNEGRTSCNRTFADVVTRSLQYNGSSPSGARSRGSGAAWARRPRRTARSGWPDRTDRTAG